MVVVRRVVTVGGVDTSWAYDGVETHDARWAVDVAR